MAKQQESKIVSAILKAFASRGCEAIKIHGGAFGVTGEPDIHACIRGRMAVIEVKVPGAKPGARQLYRLDRWRKSGALAEWFDSAAEFERWLDTVLLDAPEPPI